MSYNDCVCRAFKMVKRCTWGTCNSDSRYPERLINKDGESIRFYSFPSLKKQEERRKAWIRACCRGDKFVCKKDSYICSIHFIGNNGPTKENPDPIPATASEEKIKRLNNKRKLPLLRNNIPRKCSKKEERSAAEAILILSSSAGSSLEKIRDEIQVAEALIKLQHDAMRIASCQLEFHPQESSKDLAEMNTTTFQEHTENVVEDTATQTTLELANVPYSDAMLTNKDTMRRALFIETVKNPVHCDHYTGLDVKVLMAIYDLVKEKASQMYSWKGSRATRTSGSHEKHLKAKLRHSKVSILEQLILTLVRLRRKPSIITLANLFGISPGTATKIFISWILFLKQELAFLLPFPTLEEMHGIKVPKTFAEFPNLRCIIDCTEFYIEKPYRIASQRSTYSTYKARNTFKMFVSISFIPHFNFASNLFSGSISDKEIVKKSGFLEHLKPGDVVMADKGFNVQDLLALHQTRLIAPPLMRKGNVSAKASTATRRIAKPRVHVERLIRKLKCFCILRGAIPLALKPYINSILKVCAALVNIQPNAINAGSN